MRIVNNNFPESYREEKETSSQSSKETAKKKRHFNLPSQKVELASPPAHQSINLPLAIAILKELLTGGATQLIIFALKKIIPVSALVFSPFFPNKEKTGPCLEEFTNCDKHSLPMNSGLLETTGFDTFQV